LAILSFLGWNATGQPMLASAYSRTTLLAALEHADTVLDESDRELQAAESERAEAAERVAAIDADLVPLRARLNDVYDTYRTRFGFINRVTVSEGTPDPETGLPSITKKRPPMLSKFRRDPAFADVLALEDWDADNQVG